MSWKLLKPASTETGLKKAEVVNIPVPKLEVETQEIDKKTAEEINEKFGHLNENVGLGGHNS